MTDVAEIALKDRICDATDRIPTSRWPFYAQSLEATILEAATTATLTLEAERDLLLTDLSIEVKNIVAGTDHAAQVTIEYCNITYADHTDVGEWKTCCARKPIFLMGVRENKRLRFDIVLATAAPVGGVKVTLSVAGWQGDGCCS